MFCVRCGTKVPEDAAFCKSCGNPMSSVAGGGPQATALGSSTTFAGVRPSFPVGSVLAAGIGSTLMLIALALDWYTVRCSGDNCYGWPNPSLDFGNLTGDADILDLNWAGSGLPLVFMIIFASAILLSVGFALLTGTLMRRLWAWVAGLSIVCLVANFGYMLGDTLTSDSDWYDVTWYATPHAGWVLAFVGAIVVLIGSAMGKRTS